MTSLLTDAIIVEPSVAAKSAVIWLHGLGADGNDFVSLIPELKLPFNHTVRFIFPHAPRRPITINQGYVMRGWYDIFDLSRIQHEDEVGIQQSALLINQLIQNEHAKGIPYHKILLAGFSQGGAMALYTGLRFQQKLAGIVALSCYLPLAGTLANTVAVANRQIPIFMAHGKYDMVVPLFLAEKSKEFLQQLNYATNWHIYDMDHSVCAEEIAAIANFIAKNISV